MLKWAAIFLVIALAAALFGFTGIASAAAGIAKFLFFLFLVILPDLFHHWHIDSGRRSCNQLPDWAVSGTSRLTAGSYFFFQGFHGCTTFFWRNLHLSLTNVNCNVSSVRLNL